MNSNQAGGDSQNWKARYRRALAEQEQQELKFKQVIALLTQAAVRTSLIADGIDSQLDKQLSGMRQVLREDNVSGRDLKMMLDALEGQVKRIDLVKSERSRVLASAFQTLTKQLKALKPEADAKKQLNAFGKSLKKRSAQIQEYSALINEYAGIQQAVLTASPPKQESTSWFQKWFARGNQSEQLEENAEAELAAAGNDGADIGADIKEEPSASEKAYAEMDLADDKDVSLDDIALPDSTEKEPPFSRLSRAICGILSELLQQIEPPPMARENYKAAKIQLEKGLNWYELVPTLENISIVIISAFDRDQKELEQYLQQLNQRLLQAYEFISASQQLSSESAEAGEQLSVSVREQVSAMQLSVETATELDQLKSEVSARLEQVVAAMDQHQAGEQHRDQSLSEQLDALVERVKAMEEDSAKAEQRIEEQRQLALRDVLTQLPNREGYQQRLDHEYDRWRRYGRPLSMVVCDIDHFKRINDTYGHLAGDKVLRIIAKTLSKRLRKTDYIARYGGEEFVILMPETARQQALDVANSVREAIASCPFHFKEKPVSITMSFGITEFEQGDQADIVFERADKALYQAKDEGRNCCILAEKPPLPENAAS